MKLVVLEPLGIPESEFMARATELLPKGMEVVYYNERTYDTIELIERGKDAEAIIIANQPLSAEVIKGFEKAKLLSVAFTGIDHIDKAACEEMGITICNCAGYSTCAVADLVFGMIIDLYRNIIPCNEVVRQGGTKDGLVGFELEGKKFGVIGTGAIGLRVASIAKAFGCEVYAYSRTTKNIEGIKYVSIDELLSICDIVSLHTPLTEDTRGLINEEKLALMKKSAILINTARGPVLDSKALATALNEDRIAGAAVDVFENEPPIQTEHPLLNCKNLIATPHVAFATAESMSKRAIIALENVKCWHSGNLQNVMK